MIYLPEIQVIQVITAIVEKTWRHLIYHGIVTATSFQLIYP